MSLKRSDVGRLLTAAFPQSGARAADRETPLVVGARWDDPPTDPLDDFRRACGFDGATIETPPSKLDALRQLLLLDLDAEVAEALGRAPARDRLV